ncbi:MAG TPA: LacI family DNA-binding transcriptional regulator, partial [Opitutaceae bacterium]
MHATLPRRSSTSLAALAPRCPSPSSTGEQKRFAAAETKARVTQLDIARAAGVHNTTVSLALRNSPSIPAETRQRIQALAEKLGYCPDPALRALVAYRKGLATNRRTETIAYITHGATKWSWRDNPILEHYFVSAQQKAETCGYRLEHFWLGEPDLSDQRLSNILFHRGITGVLLASDATGRAEPLELDWERLSAVALGHSPLAPALHRVTTDATGNLRLALRQIRAAGYRRVGLVLPRSWDTAVDQGWSVGLVIEQNELPAAARIPTLFHSQPRSAGSETGERLREADDTARLAR